MFALITANLACFAQINAQSSITNINKSQKPSLVIFDPQVKHYAVPPGIESMLGQYFALKHYSYPKSADKAYFATNFQDLAAAPPTAFIGPTESDYLLAINASENKAFNGVPFITPYVSTPTNMYGNLSVYRTHLPDVDRLKLIKTHILPLFSATSVGLVYSEGAWGKSIWEHLSRELKQNLCAVPNNDGIDHLEFIQQCRSRNIRVLILALETPAKINHVLEAVESSRLTTLATYRPGIVLIDDTALGVEDPNGGILPRFIDKFPTFVVSNLDKDRLTSFKSIHQTHWEDVFNLLKYSYESNEGFTNIINSLYAQVPGAIDAHKLQFNTLYLKRLAGQSTNDSRAYRIYHKASSTSPLEDIELLIGSPFSHAKMTAQVVWRYLDLGENWIILLLFSSTGYVSFLVYSWDRCMLPIRCLWLNERLIIVFVGYVLVASIAWFIGVERGWFEPFGVWQAIVLGALTPTIFIFLQRMLPKSLSPEILQRQIERLDDLFHWVENAVKETSKYTECLNEYRLKVLAPGGVDNALEILLVDVNSKARSAKVKDRIWMEYCTRLAHWQKMASDFKIRPEQMYSSQLPSFIVDCRLFLDIGDEQNIKVENRFSCKLWRWFFRIVRLAIALVRNQCSKLLMRIMISRRPGRR